MLVEVVGVAVRVPPYKTPSPSVQETRRALDIERNSHIPAFLLPPRLRLCRGPGPRHPQLLTPPPTPSLLIPLAELQVLSSHFFAPFLLLCFPFLPPPPTHCRLAMPRARTARLVAAAMAAAATTFLAAWTPVGGAPAAHHPAVSWAAAAAPPPTTAAAASAPLSGGRPVAARQYYQGANEPWAISLTQWVCARGWGDGCDYGMWGEGMLCTVGGG